jgi:putative tricarboxylic transport membrane protein
LSDVQWPTAPITFVSHGPAGSGPHLMMSALADGMVEAGLPVRPTIEALPGQDGGDSIRRTAAAAGTDEWLLASCTPSWLTTPVVHDLPDTIDTMTPVAGLVADSYVLVVLGTDPARTAAELFATDTVASAPKRGGNTDIQAMLLDQVLDTTVTVEIVHDQPDVLDALRAGTVRWTSGVYSDFAVLLEDGTLRVVATFDPTPVDGALAPSLREQGVDVMFPLWRGVVAPGGIGDRVDAWSDMIRAALEQPAWAAYLAKERQRGTYLDPSAFGELLTDENARYVTWLREIPAS